MQDLTTRQREVLDYVRSHFATKGYGPTYRETGSQFGIRSPNGVKCHLKALVDKGRIRCDSRVPRGISLVRPGRPPNARLRHAGTIS